MKHALLGLLAERPGHGYDLLRRLDRRLGPAWQLSPSTVYAALDQLEEEGLIAADVTCEGSPAGDRRRVSRIVYEPTEDGELAFSAWLGTPSVSQEPIRSELQLKLAAARREDVPSLLHAVERATAMTRFRCEEIAAEAGAPDLDDPILGVVHAAARFHLQAELRWLETAAAALRSESSHPIRGEDSRVHSVRS